MSPSRRSRRPVRKERLGDAFRPAPAARLQATPMGHEDAMKTSPSLGLTLVLSLLLLAVALVAAPEHPEAQEAICQRHAGVEACRVW